MLGSYTDLHIIQEDDLHIITDARYFTQINLLTWVFLEVLWVLRFSSCTTTLHIVHRLSRISWKMMVFNACIGEQGCGPNSNRTLVWHTHQALGSLSSGSSNDSAAEINVIRGMKRNTSWTPWQSRNRHGQTKQLSCIAVKGNHTLY